MARGDVVSAAAALLAPLAILPAKARALWFAVGWRQGVRCIGSLGTDCTCYLFVIQHGPARVLQTLNAISHNRTTILHNPEP